MGIALLHPFYMLGDVTDHETTLDIRPHFRYKRHILPIEGRHR